MMKLFRGICIFSLLIASALAQSDETVTVKKSDLTKDQLDKITAQQMQQKIDQYGKWVGMGHEVGTAVNESLVAITTNAQNFAGTTPGKVAMFLVIYKVIGHDILGVLVAVVFLLVGLPVWIWSYRRYLPHKYLVKETVGEDKKVVREYDYGYGHNNNHVYDATGWGAAHWAFLGIGIVICLFAIFA